MSLIPTSKAKFPVRIKPKSLDRIAIASVLLLALVAYISFKPGISGFDDLLYAHSAQALLEGDIATDVITGGRGRIGHYAPLALLFLVFGPSEATTSLYTIIASLVTVVLIFKIGTILKDRNAGILAALAWVLMPLDITLATSNGVDVTMTTLNLAAVYFGLRGFTQDGGKAIRNYGLCGLLFLWGFWTKEITVLTAAFIVLYFAIRTVASQQEKYFLWVGKWIRSAWPVILAGLLGLVYYYGRIQTGSFPDSLAVTSTDIFQMLTTDIFFYYLLPLMISVLFLSLHRNNEATFPLLWFAFLFLALEWSTTVFTLVGYRPFPLRPISERGLLFLMPPIALLIGQTLSRLIDKTILNKLLLAFCASFIVLILIVKTDLIDLTSVLAASSLATILFGAISLSLVLIENRSKQSSSTFAVVFFLLMGVSVLNPVSKMQIYNEPSNAYFAALRETAEFVDTPVEYPIYFFSDEEQRTLSHLNFVSGYQLTETAFDEFSGRMRLIDRYEDAQESGYVVITDPTLVEKTSPNWWQVASFSQPPSEYLGSPPEIHVYLTLAEPVADERFAQASALSASNPDSYEHLMDLFTSAILANEPKSALDAFLKLRELDAATQPLEPNLRSLISANHELGSIPSTENLLANSAFRDELSAWETSEAMAAGIELQVIMEPTGNILQISNPDEGLSENIPISQHIRLNPDSVYAFELKFMSSAELITCYVTVGDFEIFFDGDKLLENEWTKTNLVFVTPSWGNPVDVLIAPVVVFGEGLVSIRDVSLSQLFPDGE